MKITIFISSLDSDNANLILLQENLKKLENDEDLKEIGITNIELVRIKTSNEFLAKNIKKLIEEKINESEIFIFYPQDSESKWIFYELGYVSNLNQNAIMIFLDKEKDIKNCGPCEGMHRVIIENLKYDNIYDNLKSTIIELLKSNKEIIRKIIFDNYKENLKRYFPLDKKNLLSCKFSNTSLNVEYYFLRSNNFIDTNTVYFNGYFYLKHFLQNDLENDEITVCFWFKITEENFREDRFCKRNNFLRDEPIFLFTIGNFERKENSHIGIYYGRPAVPSNEYIPPGLRIFTYCNPKNLLDIEICDSKEMFKDIKENKWYFTILTYSSNNKSKLYLYDIENFIECISSSSKLFLEKKDFLTIGGGFPLAKVYGGLDKDFNPIIFFEDKDNKAKELIYYANSSLQLKKNVRCDFNEKQYINLQPYGISFIDDFRFQGYIRELMIFNRILEKEERDNLWKITKKLI